jgi:hypothetical protein
VRSSAGEVVVDVEPTETIIAGRREHPARLGPRGSASGSPRNTPGVNANALTTNS